MVVTIDAVSWFVDPVHHLMCLLFASCYLYTRHFNAHHVMGCTDHLDSSSRPTIQALNVLMLKLLENCNRNHSFAVMLQLIVTPPPEIPGKEERLARWNDLVVKCLIKLTKALPSTIEVGHAAHLSTVLCIEILFRLQCSFSKYDGALNA